MKLSRVLRSVLSYGLLPFLNIKSIISSTIGFSYLNRIKNKDKNCIFEGGGDLYFPGRVQLGSDIYIGKNFFINAAAGLNIGSYSHISRNVTIHTRNHNYQSNLLPYDKTYIENSVKIGKYVWIGMGVNILPGVTIGDGAIIGMGTTVSKDVPSNAIVTGEGMTIRKYRDAVKTRNLVESGSFLTND